ncbi:transposase [Piscirickettsia litoralis]|uniref:Tc1-like transposase DDE domain-containing protein n=1 Tax=Piscirickettsia litoralis TaxID=1891921 RepID=A0ABX3A3Y7_9GAMM|nr:transposase [Piscirickettsia litoralis]ODN42368.1 hypothetical protein BGC07_04755 [Piscirickettsia litoralis]
MPSIDPSNLIVLDESGFPLNLTKLHGRCLTKERLKMPVPIHGENISALGAVSLEKVIDIGMVNGAVDQDCVEAFIKHSLLPKLQPGKILLIDNAPVHNVKKIKEMAKLKGVMVLPLPRYSPDLSPIEMCWSKLKSIIRKLKPRTEAELFHAFAHAINEIESDDLEGWFDH